LHDKQIAEKLSIQTALGASTMSKQSTDSAHIMTFDASSDRNHQRSAMSVRFYLFANTWQYLWFYCQYNHIAEYFWVKEETMLDAVTALSGSGPAYFFLMIESMTNAGVALGLDKQIAEKLRHRAYNRYTTA
jgi:pyrroline-5-carboxylate reductase